MQFFIRNLEGSTSTVSADATETVLRIKEKIEACGILPVQHQLLIHAGKLLKDYSLISECGLSHGESLTLTSRLLGGKPTKVKILTNHLPCGQEVAIDIEPTASKDEIKLKLAAATGVPVEHVKVMLSGINQIVMSDKRTNLKYSFCGSTSGVQMAVTSGGK